MKVNGKDSPIYEMENKQCSKPPTRYFECVSQFMHTDLYLGTSQANVLPACNPIILWQFNRAIRKTAILKLLKMGNFQLQYVKNHGIHRVPLVFRVMETSWKCPMSTAAGRPTLKNLEKKRCASTIFLLYTTINGNMSESHQQHLRHSLICFS